jgi:hypothetical protein
VAGSAAAEVAGTGGAAAALEGGASFVWQAGPAAAIAIAPIVIHDDPTFFMWGS